MTSLALVRVWCHLLSSRDATTCNLTKNLLPEGRHKDTDHSKFRWVDEGKGKKKKSRTLIWTLTDFRKFDLLPSLVETLCSPLTWSFHGEVSNKSLIYTVCFSSKYCLRPQCQWLMRLINSSVPQPEKSKSIQSVVVHRLTYPVNFWS